MSTDAVEILIDEFEEFLQTGQGQKHGGVSMNLASTFVRNLRAALAKPSLPAGDAVPAGWKLVPIEPTGEMLVEVQDCADILPPRGKRVWKLFLDNAPAAPAAPAQPDEIWNDIERELRSCIDSGCSADLDEVDCQRLLDVMAAHFGRAAAPVAEPAVTEEMKLAGVRAMFDTNPLRGECWEERIGRVYEAMRAASLLPTPGMQSK